MNRSFAGIEQGLAIIGVGSMCEQTDTPAELLFDSFLQSASAGIRSGTLGSRQMLYRAEPYQIDLHLEADREHNRLIVTGQLLDVSRPEMTCPSVQIMLSTLRGNVVNTATNQFGEFRGEVENSGDLELSFLGHSGIHVVILLRDPLGQSSRR
ncbi:MAG TPA: hypothetical protein VN025_05990 [Candidatus Dormibacteraeota bacterium]|jgi:hypothetical protein|nr:hypothetical protein [Candidatus Dormibacteraeota bacterium]